MLIAHAVFGVRCACIPHPPHCIPIARNCICFKVKTNESFPFILTKLNFYAIIIIECCDGFRDAWMGANILVVNKQCLK